MQASKTRSNSTTSVLSAASGFSFTSISSTSSRADDIMERLLTQETTTDIHVWSTGNVRINTRDMMINGEDALELLSALREDRRFHYINFVYLGEGDEWKASYRLDDSSSTPSTP